MTRIYSYRARVLFGLLPLLATAAFFVPTQAFACTPNANDCGSGMQCAYMDSGYQCIAVSSGGGTAGTSGQTTAGGGTAGTSGNTTGSGGTQFYNPLNTGTSLSALLADILQLVIRIGSVVVIFMLVVVGFLFVTAQGNQSQITKARNALMWTVVGALILLGSAALAQGICATVVSLGGGSGSCPSLL